MKVWIKKDSSSRLNELDWPDDCRVPIAGEEIILIGHEMKVSRVIWAVDQDEPEVVLHLRPVNYRGGHADFDER